MWNASFEVLGKLYQIEYKGELDWTRPCACCGPKATELQKADHLLTLSHIYIHLRPRKYQLGQVEKIREDRRHAEEEMATHLRRGE